MADAALPWGTDLAVDATGDICMVSGPLLGQQRILRRLLTNLYDYTWNSEYGAGLGQYVGQVAERRKVESTIRSQIFLEASVAHDPAPVIETSVGQSGDVFVRIGYSDDLSNTAQILTFSVGI